MYLCPVIARLYILDYLRNRRNHKFSPTTSISPISSPHNPLPSRTRRRRHLRRRLRLRLPLELGKDPCQRPFLTFFAAFSSFCLFWQRRGPHRARTRSWPYATALGRRRGEFSPHEILKFGSRALSTAIRSSSVVFVECA